MNISEKDMTFDLTDSHKYGENLLVIQSERPVPKCFIIAQYYSFLLITLQPVSYQAWTKSNHALRSDFVWPGALVKLHLLNSSQTQMINYNTIHWDIQTMP